MNPTKADKPRSGALKPHLMLLPALVVVLSLAFTGAASAQTAFQASVTSTVTLPSGGCANGAYACGTANIADYGAASWNLFFTGFTNVETSCGSTYTAMTYFTLADGSTLVLDESGNLCGPGLDANGYFKGRFPKDFGRPYSAVGAPSTSVPQGGWTVDPTSTGQFLGVTGSGTDVVYFAGAHAAGTYTGTLG